MLISLYKFYFLKILMFSLFVYEIFNFIDLKFVLILLSFLILSLISLSIKKLTNKKMFIFFLLSLLFSFIIYITNQEVLKSSIDYLKIIFPILITVIIFILNLFSQKILDKPFSFYYTKKSKNIKIIFFPFIVIILLIPFDYFQNLSIYLILTNDIFFTLLIIDLINDVFQWNKGDIYKYYIEEYELALMELPFNENYSNEIYFQFENVKKLNEDIDYKKIYKERLRKILTLKNYGNANIDDFTIILIKESIITQGENNVDFLGDSIHLYHDFVNKVDKNFIRMALGKKEFTIGKDSKEKTFFIFLSKYMENVKYSMDFKILKSYLIDKRKDLKEEFITQSLYLALYKQKKYDILIEKDYEKKTLEEYVVIEAITKENNQLIKKEKIEKYNEIEEINVPKIEEYDLKRIYERLNVKNYKELKRILEDYKYLFDMTCNEVLYTFEFHGTISTDVLFSENLLCMLEFFKEEKYENLENGIKNKDINFILEFDEYLNVTNDLYRRKNKGEKKELQAEVEKIFDLYNNSLFKSDNHYRNINFIRENYNLSNGILSEQIRKIVEEQLRKDGEYNIPILTGIKDKKEKDKLESLETFYKTYSDEINNSEDILIFEGHSVIVKKKIISKKNIFKIYISTLNEIGCLSEFTEEKKLLENEYFQKTLAFYYFYDKSIVEEVVDINNPIFIVGLQSEIKKVLEIDDEFIYEGKSINKEEKINEFKNIFENKKMYDDLKLEEFTRVKFLEDIKIPYKFKNFDDETFKELEKYGYIFLRDITQIIEFISQLICSKYFNKKNKIFNCTFIEIVLRVFNDRLEGELSKEYNELLKEVIFKISDLNKVNNAYEIKDVSEYESIKRLVESLEGEVKDVFIEQIINNIESYIIRDMIN